MLFTPPFSIAVLFCTVITTVAFRSRNLHYFKVLRKSVTSNVFESRPRMGVDSDKLVYDPAANRFYESEAPSEDGGTEFRIIDPETSQPVLLTRVRRPGKLLKVTIACS